MASSYFTPRLGLNQWQGSDKPKRSDFNNDNSNLEQEFTTFEQNINAHKKNDTVHITDAERQQWSKGKTMSITTYTGNGAADRTITLGYHPELVIIFATNKGLVQFLGTNTEVSIYSAVLTRYGSSIASALLVTGVQVKNTNGANPEGNSFRLNEQGTTYVCLHR